MQRFVGRFAVILASGRIALAAAEMSLEMSLPNLRPRLRRRYRRGKLVPLRVILVIESS